MRDEPLPSPLRVSVVICTAGRRKTLPATLEALGRQTYPHFEVILAVGPSKDGTLEYAQSLPNVRVTRVDALNMSRSRNVGIRAAAGDIVAFIDDDACADPHWLKDIVNVFEREGPSCAAVGGTTVIESHPTRPLQFRYGQCHLHSGVDCIRLETNPTAHPDGPWFPYLHGTDMAFRRDVLIQLGGFDEQFVFFYEDPDICVRLLRAGYSVIQHSRALVHHYPALSHNRRGGHHINWFMLLRSGTYFSLKHARATALKTSLAVARRNLHLLRHYASWTAKLEISPIAAAWFTASWLRGFLHGAWLGWSHRRQRAALPPLAVPTVPRFRPFQTRRTHRAPAAPPARKPLRIGLACAEYGSGFGGIGMYTKHLAAAYTAQGHSVVIFRCGWAPLQQPPHGYDVVDVPHNTALYQAAVFATIRKHALLQALDIVEAPLWNGEGAAVGMLGPWPLITRLETPSEIIRRISALPLDEGMTRSIAAEQLQLSFTAGAIAISRAIQKTVEDVYALKLATHGRQAAVIPIGLPGWKSLPLQAIALPTGRGPRFLYVGRLESRKGTIELGEAFATVAKALPTATLWIVGADNSAHDGHQRRTGKTYVETLRAAWPADVAQRVHFFGQVAEPVKNYLFTKCDVFVAPSRYESFGIIYLEAMRAGKAAIGTSVGGVPEIVSHGETGLLVPPEAPRALADAMITLGENAKLRQQLGHVGLDRFEQEFTLAHCARRSIEFYRQVLADWHGQRIEHAADLVQRARSVA